MLSPHQIAELLSKSEEPDGKVINRKTELINKQIVKDSLSDTIEIDGKWYVKRIQLVHKYELVELTYELYRVS